MKIREPLHVMQLARIGLVEYRNMALTSRKHADLPSPASPAAAKPIKSDVKAKTSVGAGSTPLATALTTTATTAPTMGLPCQMDHMYANSNNYNQKQTTANMPNGKSETSEVDHLKALVLLHLDLAQHQAELLAAKDKEIAKLKEENQTLKQRLERNERRVPTSTSSKNETSSTNPSTSSTPVPTSVESCGPSSSVPSAPTSSPATDEEILTVDDKPEREPVKPVAVKTANNAVQLEGATPNTDKHPPLRSKSKKHKLPTETATLPVENNVAQNTASEEPQVGSESHSTPTSASLPSKVPRKTSGDPISRSPVKRKRVHSPLEKQTKTDPSEAQLKAESPPPSPTSLDPEHIRIQRLLAGKGPPKESNPFKSDSILTTETPYFTLVGEQHDSDIEDTVVDTSEIEVPRWLIKPVPSLYAIEGTENLDDEIFLKRHHKHESDEKRRKRWDLQRIREQRQYEKLRARYEGEDRCQERGIDNRDLRNQDYLGNLSTLWHDPDNASALQVESWLPVTAFGAPLPALQTSEFSLPWVSSTSSRSKAINESSRKRHRR